jgi:hypothetical protein
MESEPLASYIKRISALFSYEHNSYGRFGLVNVEQNSEAAKQPEFPMSYWIRLQVFEVLRAAQRFFGEPLRRRLENRACFSATQRS